MRPLAAGSLLAPGTLGAPSRAGWPHTNIIERPSCHCWYRGLPADCGAVVLCCMHRALWRARARNGIVRPGRTVATTLPALDLLQMSLRSHLTAGLHVHPLLHDHVGLIELRGQFLELLLAVLDVALEGAVQALDFVLTLLRRGAPVVAARAERRVRLLLLRSLLQQRGRGLLGGLRGGSRGGGLLATAWAVRVHVGLVGRGRAAALLGEARALHIQVRAAHGVGWAIDQRLRDVRVAEAHTVHVGVLVPEGDHQLLQVVDLHGDVPGPGRQPLQERRVAVVLHGLGAVVPDHGLALGLRDPLHRPVRLDLLLRDLGVQAGNVGLQAVQAAVDLMHERGRDVPGELGVGLQLQRVQGARLVAGLALVIGEEGRLQLLHLWLKGGGRHGQGKEAGGCDAAGHLFESRLQMKIWKTKRLQARVASS
mmetsp:Transcript_22657/g.57784  ORF Transcript_22657/g.57784 Transcript_22657/m.57784 type:complete len:424 (+) Transcript_22657:70-1341(+)